MSWRDILKNSAFGRSEDDTQELLISFREFTPIREITKGEEEEFLSYTYSPKYERTLEFMKPFDEIKRDGLHFVFKFDIYGVSFTFKRPFLGQGLGGGTGIGEKAGDTFPIMDSTAMKFCVKATSVMTNGDFMATLLLASKNNQLPTILTLPAYVEKHYPELKMHKTLSFLQDNRVRTIFDEYEQGYKESLLKRIWEHVEGLDKIDWPPFSPAVAHLDEKLKEYIPEELLGRW